MQKLTKVHYAILFVALSASAHFLLPQKYRITEIAKNLSFDKSSEQTVDAVQQTGNIRLSKDGSSISLSVAQQFPDLNKPALKAPKKDPGKETKSPPPKISKADEAAIFAQKRSARFAGQTPLVSIHQESISPRDNTLPQSQAGNYPSQTSNTADTNSTSTEAGSGSESAATPPPTSSVERMIYGKVPMLDTTASLFNISPFSRAWASTCEAQVSLYQLGLDGKITGESLMSSPVDSRGIFIFRNLHTIELPQTLKFDYILLLEANGCTMTERLVRYLTDTSKPQDFSYAQNLIASTRLTESYSDKDNWDLNKIEQLAQALSGENSTSRTYHDKLLAQTANENLFNEVFGITTTRISQVTPLPHFTSVFTELLEKETYTQKAQAEHWDEFYPLLYEWIWDGVSVSNDKDFNLTLTANEQGERSLVLRIGQNDGMDQVDITKDYLQYIWTTNVEDTYPVVTPDYALVTDFEGFTNQTTVDLEITTEADLAACETFSAFVIKETSATPSLAEFDRACDTAPLQVESYTLVNTTDGAKNLYLWSIDSSGNLSSAKIISFNLITTGPLAPVASLNTPAITGVTSSKFSLSSCPAGVTIAYNLTGIAPMSTDLDWVACSTISEHYTQTLPTLEQNHEISIWARDAAGNISAASTLNIIYDVTAPALNLATLLTGAYRGGDQLTLDFSTSDTNGLSAFRLEYAQDGSTYSTVTTFVESTTSYLWTLPTHDTSNARIRLVSIDNSTPANSSSVASGLFTIDSTPPVTPVATLYSAAILNDLNFSATVSACEAGSTALISFSSTTPDRADPDWQTCVTTAGGITSALPGGALDGTKTFYLFAKDAVGNISNSATLSFIYDSTAPTLSMSSSFLSAYRGDEEIQIDYSAADTNGLSVLRLEYAQDGANFSFVKNLDPLLTNTNWLIPTDNSANARVRIVARDNALPFNETIVTSTSFIIDSTAPLAPALALHSPAISSSRDITVTALNCNDTTNIHLSLSSTAPSRDALTWQSCSLTAGALVFELPLGSIDETKTLYSFAKDAVGNISTSSTIQMIYDTTAPSLTFSTALAGTYRGGQQLTLNFSSSDLNNLSSLELFYAADGATFSSVSTYAQTDTSYTWTLPSDNTIAAKIRMVSTDNATAANVSTYESGVFAIDSTPPAAPAIALISPAITSTRDVLFSALNCTDTQSIMVKTVDVAPSRDDAGFQNCLSPTDYLTAEIPLGAVDGEKIFYLFAKDAVGNVSTTSTTISLIYDTTAPFLELSTALSGAYRGGSSLTLNYTTNDSNGISFFELQYAVDGVNFTAVSTLTAASTSTSFVFPSDNTTNAKIRLVSRDGATAANQSIVTSGTFSIDSTPPSAPAIALSSPAITSIRDFTMTAGNCTDTSHMLVKFNTIPPEITDPLWQTCSTTASAITASLDISATDGPKIAYIFAKDAVGNISTYSQVSFIYDTTIPTLTFSTTLAAKYRGGFDLNLSFATSDTNGVSSFKLLYSINGTDYTEIQNLSTSATATTWTLPTINNTNVRLRLVSTDNATPANVNTYTSGVFEIDSTPPIAPSISIVTANPTSVANLTFTHAACDDRTHIFISQSATAPTRDAAGWQTCQTTAGALSYTLQPVVAEINHTLYYYAKDDVGNVSTSSTGNIIYDITPPSLASTTTLNATYRGGEVVSINHTTSDANGISEFFLLYASDGVTFNPATRVDFNPALASSNWTFPTHNTTTAKLRLVSRDTATPKNERVIELGPFSIDSTPPSPPPVAFHAPDNTPAITSLTDVQITTATCLDINALFISQSATPPAFNHADWQACTTTLGGHSYTLIGPVPEVSHELYIFARDAVGNVSNYSSLTVIYDNTTPALNISTAINSHYPGGVNHTFNFTTSDANGVKNLSFEYAQDGVNYTTLANLAGSATSYSWATPSVNVSSARLRMRSTDNAQPPHITTWTSAAFVIDSIAPALTIASPAANSYHRSSVTVSGNCETGLPIQFSGAILEAFSITCVGGNYTQPLSFTAGDGSKLINISQTDLAGNITALNRTFIRDEVPPILTRTTGNNPAFNNTNSYTWGGTCEGNFTINVTGDQTSSFACNNGSWTFTNTNKLVDGTYNFTLNQTDSAGNVSSPLTLTWTRDATPPLFNAVTPLAINSGETKTLTTNGNNVVVSGSCEGANPIAITGSSTDVMSCSSSSWSWSSPSVATDGLRTYTFTQTDSAGNTSTLSLQWTRDTTGPELFLATAATTKTKLNTQTFEGNCEIGLNIVISGAQSTSIACTTGNWTWTTASQATDGTRNYLFAQTNGFGTTTSVSAQWIRGTSLPTVSVTNTSTASPSKVAFAKVNLTAQSNNTGIFVSHFCFKSNDDTVPVESDPCWNYVSSPSVGLPLASTVDLSDFSYLLGWTPTAYVVKSWVKDEAGNISVNANGNGVDRFNITYAPGIPPQVSDVIAANSDTTENPPTRAESVVPPGSDVYIRWKLINPEGPLPPGAVSLYYTENELDFTQISGAEALDNANYGCPGVSLTVDEGCFKWTAGSPLSTPYKIRVQAMNYSELTDQSISTILNSTTIKILAGNTESGLGGSAQTAMFLTRKEGSEADPHSLVVTNDGRFFFIDYARGIFTINPETGNQEIFIRTTGTSTGDGGAAVNATLRYPVKMTLDFQNRLLIFDVNRIRRVDLNQSTPTIETIIGGGANTADTVANPLDLSIYTHSTNSWTARGMLFFATPNGDIYFHSDYGIKNNNVASYRFRIFKAATGQVISRYISGTGNVVDPEQDMMACRLLNPGIRYNSSSMITGAVVYTHYATSYPGCDTRNDSYIRTYLNAETFESTANELTSSNQGVNYRYFNYTAMNGENYFYGDRTWLNRLNYDGTTQSTRILGSGTRGQCSDGTAPTSCNMDIQDVFITSDNKIYFVDGGLIRTIDENGLVKTLFGQRPSYGNGVNALNARFEQINFIEQRNDERIIVADSTSYLIKEFTVEGNINIIAGNGTASAQNFTDNATEQPLLDSTWLIADKATGDIYSRRTSEGQFAKLNRATGKWELIIGTGATQYLSADGMTGLSISSSSNQNYGLPIGFNGQKLMILRMRYNSPEIRWDNFSLKLYNSADNFKQEHLSGGLDDTNYDTTCTTGSLAATCKTPYYDRFYSEAQWDAANNRWLLYHRNVNRVYSYTQGGNFQIIGPLHAAHNNGVVYRKEGSDDMMYYCQGGRLHKRNLTTNTQAPALVWPVSNMYCRGMRLAYNSTRNTIIFPFEQNGLYGVAEYYLP